MIPWLENVFEMKPNLTCSLNMIVFPLLYTGMLKYTCTCILIDRLESLDNSEILPFLSNIVQEA